MILYLQRIALAVAVVLAGCGGGAPPTDPPPPPPKAKALSVATWNTLNFFDWVDDPNNDTVLSASEYQSKRQAVGAIVRLISADVIVLQEIENERTANDLQAQELSSMGYGPPVVSQGNDTRGINVAIFSRYPVVSVISHKNDTFSSPATGRFYRFARDCLEVEIDVEGVHWVVYGVHFISQISDSDDRRLAEATHVRSLFERRLRQDPAARIVVAGDLNDLPGSAPVATLLGQGDMALSDTSLSVNISLRYTYVFSGTNRQFDFVLASSGTSPGGSATTIFHDAAISNVSDHRPVRTNFPGE